MTSSVQTSTRFAFGENWKDFLEEVNDERINTAVSSVQTMLEKDSLEGLKFIDIGSGSGLFSLSAHLLGAKVHSFDYDPNSVEATSKIKQQYASDGESWTIERGDVLDEVYMKKLGKYDVVYSWGVLHHTGEMWAAIENAASLVKKNGQFVIAIYNDQGGASRRWGALKKFYNQSPKWVQTLLVWATAAYFESRYALAKIARGKSPFKPFENSDPAQNRGMNQWHDYVDWIGGYPFEVAGPDKIFHFFKDRGFTLEKMITVSGSHGCNEFTFRRL